MQALLADLTEMLGRWAAAARRRPGDTALAAALAVALVWTYGGVVRGIVGHAISDVLWYHCLLVPFGSLAIWYRTRHRIAEEPPGAWWAGGLLLMLCAALLQIGELGAGGSFLGGASIVCAAASLVALLQGKRRLRRSLFPLGFLLLGVPIPLEVVGAVAFPLQHVSAALTQHACAAMGLPVTREGVVLTLGQFRAVIAGSCSGMNSFFALLMVSAWVVGFSRMPSSRMALILVAILPTVIVANVIRLVIMMVVAMFLSDDIAMSYFHEGSDIVLFLIVLAFLVAAKLRLEGAPRLLPEDANPVQPVVWTWE